ncbi:E3 ubiquitin-protein ligase RNF170-like protein [Perilla frutescens var. hirtella]|uniref:E3 ubiquitin-protein ligase RNF170-like protein n=1 Tax=Perilla frutescens var. hirtella TaxID=608512 RepID=A0AAD4JJ82_PERFH|nr:E3 ubiquitin-protein ligase RNF170-like protein [Perilla frutescens var. hirtella]
MDGPPENDVCSICHHNFHIPCQANCSHWFCGALFFYFYADVVIVGNCIWQVWDHGPALRPCRCPLCRREITLLVPSEASLRRQNMADVAEILQRIETYNRQYGARSNSLMQRMQDLPFLLKRLLRDILDPQRSLPLVIRARVYLAMFVSAMYVISPVDFFPEALLGFIGFLDDLIVVFICFLYVAALYRAVLVTRHGGA